jgi:acetyl-CoA carboxylase biotin carboxyl carrier protein
MAFKKTSGPRANPPEDELRLIRTLAGILTETGLTEIELEKDGIRVRVARAIAIHSTMPQGAPPAAAAADANAMSPAEPLGVNAEAHPGVVKSPMVGTVYRSPSPGAPQFVELGSEVKQGQTLLIIEAMKTMNQIPAPRAGRVTQVLVESGQPVEYGEALLVIE